MQPMQPIQTVSGWASFETGHLTPEFDFNFVVYPEPGLGKGVNCKIRMYALLHSEVGLYPERGGVCRVVVRGEPQTAQHWEEGWSHGTLQYIRVSWVQLDIDDNEQFKADAQKDLTTFFGHHEGREGDDEDDLEETENEVDDEEFEEESDYGEEDKYAKRKTTGVKGTKAQGQPGGSASGTLATRSGSKRSSDEDGPSNGKKQKIVK